ncbi:hypothetical protein GE061_011357 [Apolygus lucorum]|uniref:CCHC-type domain-containing protein n=1 Tax=Apolygus lucorum TaxID=248454 RepID=A0A8S9XZX0_APOLU|nr:hypothetical protein GE061_011357 [Apolygus lucorum]
MAASISQVPVTRFSGTGFQTWKMRIITVLEDLEVEEVLKEKPVAMEETAWKKKDRKARNVITQWLSDGILHMVKDKRNSAQEMMNALNSIYDRKGLSTQITLRNKINELKFRKGELTSHLEAFDTLVNDYVSSGGSMPTNEVVSTLLSSMPKSYGAIVSGINLMYSQNPTKVTLEFVKNQLLEEEIRHGHQNQAQDRNPETAFFSRGRKRGRQNNSRGRTNNYNSREFECHKCGEPGHFRSSCDKRFDTFKGESGNSHSDNKYPPSSSNRATSHPARRKSSNHSKVNLATRQEEFYESEEEIEIAFFAHKREEEFTSLFTSRVKPNSSKILSEIDFYIDSGCTNTIINSATAVFLRNSEPVNVKIDVAKKGEQITATRRGTLDLVSGGTPIHMKGVLVCDDLEFNLLSVLKLQDSNLKVIFENGGVKISNAKDRVLVTGIQKNNLYQVKLKPLQFKAMLATTDQNLIHRRFGHSSRFPPQDLCEICLKAKQTRLPFYPLDPAKKPKRPLEVVSSDVGGPITPSTIDGSSLGKQFWGFAVQASNYIINRIPTSALAPRETPADLWYGRKVDTTNIRTWGCKAYCHIPKEDRRGKLADRSKLTYLLGYTPNGFILWDVMAKRAFAARNVVFDEKFEVIPMQPLEETKSVESDSEVESTDEDEDTQSEQESSDENEEKPKPVEYEFSDTVEEISPQTSQPENSTREAVSTPDGVNRKTRRPIRTPAYLEDYHRGSLPETDESNCFAALSSPIAVPRLPSINPSPTTSTSFLSLVASLLSR